MINGGVNLTKSYIFLEEDIKDLKNLASQGMSLKEISKYYYERGHLISKRTVSDKMEELGLKQPSQFVASSIKSKCSMD